MDLDFVRIECECSINISDDLTAAVYTAVRNFETHFRAACCYKQVHTCTSCSMDDGCPYRSVFGQELSSDPAIVRLHQKPALPFALYVRGGNGIVGTYCIGMTVIGKAVNYVEFFHGALLKTVAAALSRHPNRDDICLRSFSLDCHDVRHEITSVDSLPENVILLSADNILHDTVHCDAARILLNSPLRLLYNGSISHFFDFAAFFRSQLRRCSSLCAYYGTGEIELDYVRLSEQANTVTVFENKIQYTQPPWSKGLNKAGLTGRADCTGLTEQMLPVLLLGSYFNAGKGASFGSGFHQIEVLK